MVGACIYTWMLKNIQMNGKSNFTGIAAAIMIGVLMFVSNPAKAFREQKPYKMDISISFMGGGASVLEHRFMNGYKDFYNANNKKYPDVEHYYADYMKDMSGSTVCYNLKADVKVLPWLAVGGNLSYQQIDGAVCHGFNRGNHKNITGRVFYVMPEVRFDYFRTRLTTLSSAVSVGIGYHDGFKQTVYPEFQVYPISYSLGNVVYGKIALAFGTLINGVEFGVGVRF